MQITVHLHTILQQPSPAGPQRRVQVTLGPAGTVADVLAALEVTLAPDHLLLVVAGRLVEPAHRLADGDELHLMPAMSGG